MFILPGTELVNMKKIKSKENTTTFVIEPLLPGYGMTVGNALRRVLLSSLHGSAITWVKINDATHEFSTLTGVKEDLVDIILNLKSMKVKLNSDKSAIIKLKKQSVGKVTTADFAKNSLVEIAEPNHHIATLDKKGKILIEANIENGRGYVTVEQRQDEKMSFNQIAIDSIFTPIKRVSYDVDRTRVGGITNYDKLIINITTDGTIDPTEAICTAATILTQHFQIVADSNKKEIKKTAKKEIKKSKKIEKKDKKAKKVKIVKKTIRKSK